MRIGGGGAFQPQFSHHMYLPVDGDAPADAPAPVLVDDVAPEPRRRTRRPRTPRRRRRARRAASPAAGTRGRPGGDVPNDAPAPPEAA